MAVTADKVIVELMAKLDKYNADVLKAQTSFDRAMSRIQRSATGAERRVASSASNMASSLARAFAIVGGIRGAQSLLDSATKIDNALKVAGLSGAELEKVYDRLRESAIKNAAPLETLVTLYGRAAIVQKELKVSQEEMLKFTDRVAMALRVAGTDAQSASGALLQLSQALGSGVVRAEEFNSILEGALPIAQAAATGLKEAGGSVSRLRQLVIDGKVSSEAFFRAFEAGSYILEEKVAGATLTASQSLENVRTAAIDAMRDFARGAMAAESISDAFQMLADTINGADFEKFGAQVKELLGWLSQIREAMTWLQGLGVKLGEVTGADRFGELLTGGEIEKSFLGGAITVKSERALRSRIDAAFGATVEAAGNLTEEALRQWAERNKPGAMAVADRGGRVGTGPIGRGQSTPSQVSLSDFAAPDGDKKKKKGENAYQRETRQIKERTALLQAETAAQAQLNPLINDYEYAVTKAAAKEELLNAAKQAKIKITPDVLAAIDSMADAYANATVAANKLEEKQKQIVEANEFIGETLADAFMDMVPAIETGNKALDNFLNTLIEAVAQATLLGKGPLAGLFGFGSTGLLGNLLPFATGGYTGPGGKYQPKGVVHGGEYVFSKEATSRAGVGNLDALHKSLKGYASGGFVGSSMPSRSASSAHGGSTVVQVVLSPDLEARILEQAAGQSVQIVQASGPGMVQASVGAVQQRARNNPGYFR